MSISTDASASRRIMIVTDAWEPQVNGVEKALKAIAQELESQGHEVRVLHPDPDKFALHPLVGDKSIHVANPTNYSDPQHKVRNQILGFRPDAIYIATPEGTLGMTARRFLNQNGLPYTTGYHTRFPEYAKAKWGVPPTLTFPVARRLHQSAHRVLVPTETMRTTLEQQGLGNTAIMSRGVDLSLFHPQPLPTGHLLEGVQGKVFLYAGRVAEEKNLEAFLRLDLPGTKVVVGDGPDLARLKAKYPKVLFTSKLLPQRELAPYMTRADVFVFPSKTDTFGQVIIQALACGTPVAAYPVEGPQDIITHPGLGVLDKDLHKAVLGALALGKSGDQIAFRRHFMQEHFTWSGAAQQMLTNLSFIAPSKWDAVVTHPNEGIWEGYVEPIVRGGRDSKRGR